MTTSHEPALDYSHIDRPLEIHGSSRTAHVAACTIAGHGVVSQGGTSVDGVGHSRSLD